MPYESLAQEGWAHTPAGTKALGGAAKVAEWDAATKGKHLPRRKMRAGGPVAKEIKDDPCGNTAPTDPSYDPSCDDKPRDMSSLDQRDSAFANGGPVRSRREYGKK